MTNEPDPDHQHVTSELRSAIEASWSDETASGDNTWLSTNAAQGHCDVTALVVRETVGGDLKMVQVFRDGELSEHHYWNVLPNGEEADLTSSQFDGSETFGEPTLMDEDFFSAAGPMNADLVDRLARFRAAVARHQGTSA